MRRLLILLGARRRRMEQDLDRELRYHLERRAHDLIASGVSESEARRQAAIEFGGFAQVQEEVRDIWLKIGRASCRKECRSRGSEEAWNENDGRHKTEGRHAMAWHDHW